MKKKFNGGRIIYVNDRSGTMPRKTPKRRIAVRRNEMWTFVSEMGHEVVAMNIADATALSLANGWGTVKHKS